MPSNVKGISFVDLLNPFGETSFLIDSNRLKIITVRSSLYNTATNLLGNVARDPLTDLLAQNYAFIKLDTDVAVWLLENQNVHARLNIFIPENVIEKSPHGVDFIIGFVRYLEQIAAFKLEWKINICRISQITSQYNSDKPLNTMKIVGVDEGRGADFAFIRLRSRRGKRG